MSSTETNDAPSKGAKIGLGLAVVVLALAAAYVAGQDDAPQKLPGAALGSEAVLYLERGAAVFAIELLALVVIWRAFEGRLPDKLSGRGVEYTPKEKAEQLRDETSVALERLERADRAISARLKRLEEGR